MGFAQFGDLSSPRRVGRRRRKDEDRRIDTEANIKATVESIAANFSASRFGKAVSEMEIQIVRHHRHTQSKRQGHPTFRVLPY